MDTKLSNKEIVLNAPVPSTTSGYAPVPHEVLINKTHEHVEKLGLRVTSENYNIGSAGNKVIARFGIASDSTDLEMMIAWRNSYDKSMSLGFATGANVIICGNGMIMGADTFYIRKHTGMIRFEINGHIERQVHRMAERFDKAKERSAWMKEISRPSRQVTAELLGRMFIEEEIITSTQLGIVKREINLNKDILEGKYNDMEINDIKQQGHFVDNTMWDFYNNITEALKETAPANYIKSHEQVHTFFEENLI